MSTEPLAPVPPGRGGPQRIPRPEGAALGGPPPWVESPPESRRPSLDDVVGALHGRGSVRIGDEMPDVRQSAVLCLLYEEDGEAHVVLTRRARGMRHHAHEVAFPGGRRDDTDPDLWATAVREAEEEVALDASVIEHVGALDSFVTVGSRTLVTPFVAVTDRRPDLTPSPVEVEEIRHVSLSELLLDEVWREEIWPLRHFGRPRAITFFELEGDTVWGATGAMLRQLLAVTTGAHDRIVGGPG
ncbi:MAG: CoA pyrophosphatase [Acidimicrobiales bacterium]|nr:CoA pyrophosphatase [Acidimicrobiales bacterium]